MDDLQKYRKPLPQPDELSAPFWEAARKHELKLQHCGDCQRYIHPPKPRCPICLRKDLAWQQLSGNGRLYTFGVIYHNGIMGFENELPYISGLIELDEQPSLLFLSNIVECDPSSVQVDMPVRAVFEDVTENCTLVKFKPR